MSHMDLATLYPLLSPDEKRRLCAAADISAAYLSQLANGVRTNPPIDKCKALVDAEERLTLRELAIQFERQAKASGGEHAASQTDIDTITRPTARMREGSDNKRER